MTGVQTCALPTTESLQQWKHVLQLESNDVYEAEDEEEGTAKTEEAKSEASTILTTFTQANFNTLPLSLRIHLTRYFLRDLTTLSLYADAFLISGPSFLPLALVSDERYRSQQCRSTGLPHRRRACSRGSAPDLGEEFGREGALGRWVLEAHGEVGRSVSAAASLMELSWTVGIDFGACSERKVQEVRWWGVSLFMLLSAEKDGATLCVTHWQTEL